MGKFNSHDDPLLYIHQSDAHMQQGYSTPKRIPVTKSYNNRKTRRKSSYFKSPHLIEEEQAEQEEQERMEEGESESQKPTRQELRGSNAKKFKDMTLEERVFYFADAPPLSPKLRCEVQTAKRSYRGKIVDFAENIVYIRVGRRISTEK